MGCCVNKRPLGEVASIMKPNICRVAIRYTEVVLCTTPRRGHKEWWRQYGVASRHKPNRGICYRLSLLFSASSSLSSIKPSSRLLFLLALRIAVYQQACRGYPLSTQSPITVCVVCSPARVQAESMPSVVVQTLQFLTIVRVETGI